MAPTSMILAWRRLSTRLRSAASAPPTSRSVPGWPAAFAAGHRWSLYSTPVLVSICMQNVADFVDKMVACGRCAGARMNPQKLLGIANDGHLEVVLEQWMM